MKHLINLNESVRVKVTEDGKIQWDRFWKKQLGMINNPKIPELKVNEDGYTDLQMHELMLVFGSKMYIGAKPMFERNDMFKKKDQP